MPRIKKRLTELYEVAASIDTLDVAVRLTFVMFVFGANIVGDEWYYKTPIRILAIAGLVVPAFGRHRFLWLGISFFMGVKTIEHWWMQDNHLFLMTWWTFAVTVSLFLRDTGRILSTNARILIGLSFAFATLWKGLLSPEFMNGSYFHYTFLTDSRFQPAGMLLTDMTAADYQHNFQQVARLVNFQLQVEAVQVRSTRTVELLTLAVTWWTIAIEGALGLLFLIPTRWRLSKYRHAALLLFGWTTYLVAPVKTFGWTLMTLGVAQSDGPRTRIAYAVTALVIMTYDYIPYLEIANDLLARIRF